MERRKFIKRTGGLIGGVTFGATSLSANSNENFNKLIPVPGKVPRRKILSSGAEVSMIGFPGNALRHYNQEETNKGVKWAIENGINLFDVAPAYGKDGECEIKLGNALQHHDRDKIFLACKTRARDKNGAKEELERSLKRLKTDHFDLYQMHYLRTLEEVEEAFGPDGCMKTILQAKKEGKIKHIGFSAHTSLSALAVMDKFKFDTVMFPINFIEHFSFAFGQAVLEKAKNQGVSVLTIKSTSGGSWPKDTPREKREWWYKVVHDEKNLNMALRFALSQHNVVAALPASFIPHLQASVEAVKAYQPISKKEMEQLHVLAREGQSVFLPQQEKGLTSFNNQFLNNGEEM
ncbi:MAG: aldo/keto reductase, partial [Draconibacterium sp.]|nr:aldo/keto reductase [Draconibacterium sp.]